MPGRGGETPSPLGPGGRPFRGWRVLPMLLALAALGSNLVILLSDRAPGLFRRLSLKIDAGVARAANAAGTSSDVRVPQSDFYLHVALWAVAALLVGLATWSWGSLLLASAGLFGCSVVVEGSQRFLTTTRHVQISDAVGNLVGVALGTGAVVAFAVVWRLRPSRPRGGTPASTPPG